MRVANHHRLGSPVRESTGLSGIKAAAIVRPSSCSKLNVEHALRCVCDMVRSEDSFFEIPRR